MRYCVHCGAPLDAGQRFCTGCGRAAGPAAATAAATPAPSAPPPPAYAPPPPLPPLPPLPPRRRSGGRAVAVIVLVLAVMGAGVGAFVLVRHLTAPDAAPAAAAATPTSSSIPTAPTTPATAAAAPTTGSTTGSTTTPVPTPTDDASAAQALHDLAAQDRSAVLALHGAWTVQLTSKTDGTVDSSGRVWHWLDIWNLHQQLLASHPGALLVATGEWGSYQLSGYYATLTGETFPDKAATLEWCRSNRLGRDACAGKRVRVDGDYHKDIALQPE